MKVLVTGASGFLGTYICEMLKENNHEIVGLFHSSNKNIDSTLKYLKMDITKPEHFKKLNEFSFDSVIHNAGYVNFEDNTKNFMKLINVNVQGTLNVLNFCIKKNIENFVYSSSVSVYAKSTNIISESDPCFPDSYYGMSKLLSEFICKKYQQENDLNCCIFRYGGLYGYGAKHYVSIMNFIDNIIDGNEITIFNKNSLRNYLYVKDAAFANLLGIEIGLNGLYNIVSDEVMKIVEMVDIIRDIFKEYAPRVKFTNDNDKKSIIYDSQKFKQICQDFPKYSFEESIKEIKFMKENHAK